MLVALSWSWQARDTRARRKGFAVAIMVPIGRAVVVVAMRCGRDAYSDDQERGKGSPLIGRECLRRCGSYRCGAKRCCGGQDRKSFHLGILKLGEYRSDRPGVVEAGVEIERAKSAFGVQ